MEEKWCILRNPETAKHINKWYNDLHGFKNADSIMRAYSDSPAYFYSDGAKFSVLKQEGYTEIVFSEFFKFESKKDIINHNYSFF